MNAVYGRMAFYAISSMLAAIAGTISGLGWGEYNPDTMQLTLNIKEILGYIGIGGAASLGVFAKWGTK